MIIDWYTIIFQIINFLILVFLLRHFLYGPIIKSMDEREQKILQREKTAEARKKEAEEEILSYRRKNEELEETEEEIMAKAHREAEQEKNRLLDEARHDVDETRKRWEADLEREKETFINELRRRIGRQACLVARRCLSDLADARLEELTWSQFLKKLAGLPDEERERLRGALADGDGRVVLHSAFDTGDKQVKELEIALKELLPSRDDQLEVVARSEPDLICGLELESGGYRVAWNVESYLQDVEEQILKELDQTIITKENNTAEKGEVSENDRPAGED
ncbi:MAG: hypothetical protein AVO34_07240 [Firmicutes bacterium ML8_F2]|nr:MAG: hypothetical protein AVO34_07240 [Firmicutes bacterium ML8_F2]